MPTYSYRCPACGSEYDKFQKMSDTTLAECPDCGTRGERQISAGAGFIFKGSGFYETDYKRKGERRTKDGIDESDKPDKKEPAKAGNAASDEPKPKPETKPKTGEAS